MAYEVKATIGSYALGPAEPAENLKMEGGAWTDWTIKAPSGTSGRFINAEVGDEGFIDEVVDGKTIKHAVKIVAIEWEEGGGVKVGLKRRPEASPSPADETPSATP